MRPRTPFRANSEPMNGRYATKWCLSSAGTGPPSWSLFAWKVVTILEGSELSGTPGPLVPVSLPINGE